MIRHEVLKSIIPVISDELVICNIGLLSTRAIYADDRLVFLYAWHYGASSSIGLGLAITQPQSYSD